MSITFLGWLYLVLAAGIIGISKTGFPGAGILAIPLVALVIPAKASTGLILPMLLVGDVMAVVFYRRHAVWKYLAKLMPCAAVGIVIGDQCLGVISDRQLKPLIGGVILVLLMANWWRDRRLAKAGQMRVPEGWWFAVVLGVLAGITTMMANAAGPIVIIYLLAMRLPKTAFIGTGAWFYLVLNTFKIPFSWHRGLITVQSLWLNAKLAGVIVVGGMLGLWLVKHVPEKTFTRFVQLLAALAAVQLVVSVWT